MVWVFFVIGGKNWPGPVVLVCMAFMKAEGSMMQSYTQIDRVPTPNNQVNTLSPIQI